MDIHAILEKQRAFYKSQKTLPLAFRLDMLNKLKTTIQRHEQAIFQALEEDLHKAPMEVYMTEIAMVYEEINFAIKHLRNWMQNKTLPTPLSQFPAKSFISPQPYGIVLIMSAWNYPFQLCLCPLVGAISAGNCVVLKPSAYTSQCSSLLGAMLSEVFAQEYVTVVQGGREQNSALLEEAFDKIFFTGSVQVGKVVMQAAAAHLTPVTLELGGKSPVIVARDADLSLCAKRVLFGKLLNAGQTCVAPDYVLVARDQAETFVDACKCVLEEFFPSGTYEELPVIVSDKHFRRLIGLMQGENILVGGQYDVKKRFIAPAILGDVQKNSPIMQEEIFGPILPLVYYDTLDEAILYIAKRSKPLALYLFTQDKKVETKVLSSLHFGGGCINDTIMHLATPYMGFGGVGASGMGRYHGKDSFDTFTHYRSIVKKATWFDLNVRYHPYSEKKLQQLRKVMKP